MRTALILITILIIGGCTNTDAPPSPPPLETEYVGQVCFANYEEIPGVVYSTRYTTIKTDLGLYAIDGHPSITFGDSVWRVTRVGKSNVRLIIGQKSYYQHPYVIGGGALLE